MKTYEELMTLPVKENLHFFTLNHLKAMQKRYVLDRTLQCNTCNQEKRLVNFYSDNDTISDSCKVCNRKKTELALILSVVTNIIDKDSL